MFMIQTTKIIPAIAPAAIVDSAAFTSNVIDLNLFDGAGYIEFVGQLGSIDATMPVLRVMESDTADDATTPGGTPTEVIDAAVKPTAANDGRAFVLGVDLRAPRGRYLQLQATAGNGAAGTYLAAWAVARPGVETSSAEVRGLRFAEYIS